MLLCECVFARGAYDLLRTGARPGGSTRPASGVFQGLGLGGGDSRVLEWFRGLREKPCVCVEPVSGLVGISGLVGHDRGLNT